MALFTFDFTDVDIYFAHSVIFGLQNFICTFETYYNTFYYQIWDKHIQNHRILTSETSCVLAHLGRNLAKKKNIQKLEKYR